LADERSNSLVIAASKGDSLEAIKSVVEKSSARILNPMSNIYVIKLKYNSAKQLQTAMKALFDKRAEMRGLDSKTTRPEDKVELQVDEASNSLLMVGSRENYEVLAQKVKELDIELGVPGQIEFFVCTNVGAHRVKDTIDALFKDAGVFKPGGAPGGDVGKAREKVNVGVDDRSNMLIVSASPENMELIREIYKRMNSVSTPWDVAITKMIIIEHGDSVKIAAQIQDYFKKLDEVRDTGGDKKGKSGFGITIFADERSNRIVIGGTKDGIDSAVELVKQMDVPPGTPGQVVEVYKLTEAPASKIAEIIDKVFKERNKPRGGDTGTKVENVPVIVQSEGSTNSLLINASREDHILLKELITRLDRPSTLLEMVKVIPLEKAPSARVKEILEELYKSSKSGDSKDGGGVAVVEDSRTNSVVVTAPPGELENIATLVKRLDDTEVKGQAEVGIFHCENEDAATMADLLNSIMTGQGVSGGGSKKSSSSSTSSSTTRSSSSGGGATQSEEKRDIASMLISLATKDERGREIFLKTIRENVQITSNERTNSVIVVAPPSSLKLIEQLIRELDQIQKRPVMVKVFVLRNADATKMIDLLDKMFAQEEGKEEEAAFQRGREITVEGGGTSTTGVPASEAGAGTTAKGTFGRPKTTFVADERTNAIIVAGWPEDIDVVADVIDRLDSQPIQDRENIVYSLVNQQAKDVQAALDEYFQAETQRLDSLGDTVSPQRRMEQEVSIIAHEPSNQLILSVSPRYKQQVMSLIEQIDTAPPQVMIQVMIAEVTLDDRFEMGLEFALQQLRFSETAVPGGNGVLQSSHFDVVGGTDLGAAGSGLGGFSFTLTGEDFNFLVRALQSDSRLEVIQRPMIMCQDNQQATIQIGQSVPTPSGSQAFAGQTSTQVQYQDVGVILNVEPHINPDGFVYMLVEPEVSSVSDSTLQIAPGAFAPVINQRRATTYVSVKDGETFVIGGLITTSESEAEAKVPVLGDIPGLGILFRSTVRTKNKTELLIAMTPKVVRTIEDSRRISIEARDQSGIITDNMKQSPMFGELQVRPENEDEISTLEETPESGEGGVVPANYEGPATPEEKEPGPTPAGPRPVPREPQSPKPIYGPEVPKYGPMAPSSEDAVARR
jgi:type II secretory pathway component GspD/PulD (secretin)